ncbi:uncharacterized protein TRIADDRAFT_52048 [Trichoplax adhaerens]|uniref:EGF-like domain-containing protein n=1 Tax=Trichoplax adhaerens TaxID=10228 RepID=B3RLL8_TRIAD|nr:predicted protein [Trichoplax adhaerens]EDV29551.1 predicted protein [Trichoplax adhaerens]|eukprot:XP_002108753.1 predicted protein [Trichoplax adhaerens]
MAYFNCNYFTLIGATAFDGRNYMAVNITDHADNMTLQFQIKSNQIDGQLFLLPISGNSSYLSIQIKSGYLKALWIIHDESLGLNSMELNNGVLISNHQPHMVNLYRLGENFILQVDSFLSHSQHLLAPFNRYSIHGIAYIGGTPSEIQTRFNLTQNFIGCMHNITFSQNNANLFVKEKVIIGNLSQLSCQNQDIQLAYLSKSQSSIQFMEQIYNQSAEYNLTFVFRASYSQQTQLLYITETQSMHMLRLFINNKVIFVDVSNFAPLPAVINRDIFDGYWHHLSVILNRTHCRVILDNEETTLTSLQPIDNQNKTQNRTVTIQFHGSLPIIMRVPDANNVENFIIHKYIDRYQQSCYDIFRLQESKADGWYNIDPDGPNGLLQPFPTFCSRSDLTITTIRHQFGTNPYNVPQNNSIGPGARVIDITYQDGIGIQLQNISISQITALINNSNTCGQVLNYFCSRSVLLNYPHQPYVWWVSRHGQAMNSWSGAPIGSRKCACGTVDSCINKTKVCNCDANRQTWASDEGTLTSKAHLPVTQVHVGYQSNDIQRQSLIQLGSLTCDGQAPPSDIITLTSNRHGIALNRQQLSDGHIRISFKGKSVYGILLFLQGLSTRVVLTVSPKQVNLTYDLGQGHGQQQLSVAAEGYNLYNDDNWHQIRFSLSLSGSWLSVDQATSFEKKGVTSTIHQLIRFDLSGILSIGYNSAMNMDGFTGCLGDFFIGLKKYSLQQYIGNTIVNSCKIPCFKTPCQHFSVCQGNYSSFYCDCSSTQYIGPVCSHIRGAQFSNGNGIRYTNSEFNPSDNRIFLSFWTNLSHIDILNLKLSIENSPQSELILAIDNSRILLVVNDSNIILNELNRVKYNDQQRHDVLIDLERNLISVDGKEVQDVVKLSLHNNITIQLGDGNNGLGGLCLNNVSILGLRLLDLAYQSPKSQNIEFIPNQSRHEVKEAICINGQILPTTTSTTLTKSTTHFTNKIPSTTKIPSTNKPISKASNAAPTTSSKQSTTSSSQQIFTSGLGTGSVPFVNTIGTALTGSQQSMTIGIVAGVVSFILVVIIIVVLYWYYVLRPKKEKSIELTHMDKEIIENTDQPDQIVGSTSDQSNHVSKRQSQSITKITPRNSNCYDNDNDNLDVNNLCNDHLEEINLMDGDTLEKHEQHDDSVQPNRSND